MVETEANLPAEAIQRYVISGAESAKISSTVLRLAETLRPAARRAANDPGVMPVPLFESIDALRDAGNDHAAGLEFTGI